MQEFIFNYEFNKSDDAIYAGINQNEILAIRLSKEIKTGFRLAKREAINIAMSDAYKFLPIPILQVKQLWNSQNNKIEVLWTFRFRNRQIILASNPKIVKADEGINPNFLEMVNQKLEREYGAIEEKIYQYKKEANEYLSRLKYPFGSEQFWLNLDAKLEIIEWSANDECHYLKGNSFRVYAWELSDYFPEDRKLLYICSMLHNIFIIENCKNGSGKYLDAVSNLEKLRLEMLLANYAGKLGRTEDEMLAQSSAFYSSLPDRRKKGGKSTQEKSIPNVSKTIQIAKILMEKQDYKNRNQLADAIVYHCEDEDIAKPIPKATVYTHLSNLLKVGFIKKNENGNLFFDHSVKIEAGISWTENKSN